MKTLSRWAPQALFAASLATLSMGTYGLVDRWNVKTSTPCSPCPMHQRPRMQNLREATMRCFTSHTDSVHSVSSCLQAAMTIQTPHANGQHISAWSTVAWNGQEYALAFLDIDVDDQDTSNLMFLRLDARGKPIGKAGFITQSTSLKLTPSIAWSGTHWAVGWTETDNATYLSPMLQWISKEGAPVGPAVRLASREALAGLPVLAKTHDGKIGAGYIALNDDAEQVSLQFTTRKPDGAGTTNLVLSKASIAGEFAVVPHGTSVLVAWPDAAQQKVFALAVPTTGAPSQPISFPFSPEPDRLFSVSVVADARRAFFVWDSYARDSNLLFARRTDGNTDIAPRGLRNLNGTIPSTALVGNTLGVALESDDSANHALFATLSSEGVTGRITTLGAEHVASALSDVASDGTSFGVTYTAIKRDSIAVRFLRFDPQGKPLSVAEIDAN